MHTVKRKSKSTATVLPIVGEERAHQNQNQRHSKNHESYESGSVTSSIDGGGINPCDAAASTRAAFAACISPTPPSVGDFFDGGASDDGIAAFWPVSEVWFGRMAPRPPWLA